MARALKGVRIRDIRAFRPKLPLYVIRFIRRMTEPNPERRFATPDEALRFLDEWKAQEERKFRMFLIATCVTTAVLLAAVLYFGLKMIGAPDCPAALPEPLADDSEFSIPDSVK